MPLHFDNSFSRLPTCFYSKQTPIPVNKPELIHLNEAAAFLLGITSEETSNSKFINYFSGNELLSGSEPIATVYSGHQFGYYVPQLGDGRALLLGEIITPNSERWDVQLKGAGLTPYSRMADGRAVLRSTIREYLCSEAMHSLGIPSTRSLCIIGTNEAVYREVPEPGAILTRLAISHIRFGHFEYFYYTNQHDALKKLADYVLDRHYPYVAKDCTGYLHLFEQAVLKTAKLMALWQAYGFCHGVMNTDNMSILGLTIDYGPFGFLDTFDRGHICNSSDTSGRYAFHQQPGIAQWNLMALGQALTPLLKIEKLNEALHLFIPEFNNQYLNLMYRKTGLAKPTRDDKPLLDDLLNLLETNKVDYTSFFRLLSTFDAATENAKLTQLFKEQPAFKVWLERYAKRLESETVSPLERQEVMNNVNPKYILRNYLAEIAIEKAYEHKDYQEIDNLYKLLQKPYDEQIENEHYAAKPPDWSTKITVSCSS